MNRFTLIPLLSLLLLAPAIIYVENFRVAFPPGREPGEGLILVGYEYNRQLVQLSITLRNLGPRTITIKDVFYDGRLLTRGAVGASYPWRGGGVNTTDIVFARPEHWNMYTGGPTSPGILPGGFATLYLGVTATEPGSEHFVRLVTSEGEYLFRLPYGG